MFRWKCRARPRCTPLLPGAVLIVERTIRRIVSGIPPRGDQVNTGVGYPPDSSKFFQKDAVTSGPCEARKVVLKARTVKASPFGWLAFGALNQPPILGGAQRGRSR